MLLFERNVLWGYIMEFSFLQSLATRVHESAVQTKWPYNMLWYGIVVINPYPFTLNNFDAICINPFFLLSCDSAVNNLYAAL